MTAKTAACYRSSQPVPLPLKDHCNIYFEEHLHENALTLLSNLSHANNQLIVDEKASPAYTPSERVLGLLSTLSVHPQFTTRTKLAVNHRASAKALKLLHDVFQNVGPINGNFRGAFAFSSSATTSSPYGRRNNRLQTLKRGRESGENSDTSSGKEGDEDLDLDLVHEESLYRQAGDFWHVVGWSFNSACAQNVRWSRWKLWLSFMLNVLEDDWTIREEKVEQASGQSRDPDASPKDVRPLKGSIFFDYVTASGTRVDRHYLLRIMKAIFADGGTNSNNEFGQIFDRELATPKENDEKAADVKDHLKRRVDLDKQDFGDYWNDDDEWEEMLSYKTQSSACGMAVMDDPLSISTLPSASRASKTTLGSFGGIEALDLRKRFLSLLIRASYMLGDSFVGINDLLRLISELIYPLSLPVCMGLWAPPSHQSNHYGKTRVDSVLITAYSNLYLLILRPLQSASGYPPSEFRFPKQSDLQTHYLRRAANDRGGTHKSLSDDAPRSKAVAIIDNAKVAILLELLVRTLWRHQKHALNKPVLQSGKGLFEAHAEGAEMRKRKIEEVIDTEENMDSMTVEATPQAKRRATRKSHELSSMGPTRKLKPDEKDAMISWESAEERLSLVVNAVEGIESEKSSPGSQSVS